MAYGTLNISELDMVFYTELPFLGSLYFVRSLRSIERMSSSIFLNASVRGGFSVHRDGISRLM
jgi:hypothetical protein